MNDEELKYIKETAKKNIEISQLKDKLRFSLDLNMKLQEQLETIKDQLTQSRQLSTSTVQKSESLQEESYLRIRKLDYTVKQQNRLINRFPEIIHRYQTHHAETVHYRRIAVDALQSQIDILEKLTFYKSNNDQLNIQVAKQKDIVQRLVKEMDNAAEQYQTHFNQFKGDMGNFLNECGEQMELKEETQQRTGLRDKIQFLVNTNIAKTDQFEEQIANLENTNSLQAKQLEELLEQNNQLQRQNNLLKNEQMRTKLEISQQNTKIDEFEQIQVFQAQQIANLRQSLQLHKQNEDIESRKYFGFDDFTRDYYAQFVETFPEKLPSRPEYVEPVVKTEQEMLEARLAEAYNQDDQEFLQKVKSKYEPKQYQNLQFADEEQNEVCEAKQEAEPRLEAKEDEADRFSIDSARKSESKQQSDTSGEPEEVNGKSQNNEQLEQSEIALPEAVQEVSEERMNQPSQPEAADIKTEIQDDSPKELSVHESGSRLPLQDMLVERQQPIDSQQNSQRSRNLSSEEEQSTNVKTQSGQIEQETQDIENNQTQIKNLVQNPQLPQEVNFNMSNKDKADETADIDPLGLDDSPAQNYNNNNDSNQINKQILEQKGNTFQSNYDQQIVKKSQQEQRAQIEYDDLLGMDDEVELAPNGQTMIIEQPKNEDAYLYRPKKQSQEELEDMMMGLVSQSKKSK